MTARVPLPLLRTERLTLTPHAVADFADFVAMWQDPSVYAMIGGAPRAAEDVWIRLLRAIGTWTAFGYGSWVLRETASGRFVGEAGLLEHRRPIVPPIDAVPEVGWALAGWAQGRGFAHEALDAVFAWGDAQGIARTTCIIDPDNAPSLRLAAKVGYAIVDTRSYHDKPIHVLERAAG